MTLFSFSLFTAQIMNFSVIYCELNSQTVALNLILLFTSIQYHTRKMGISTRSELCTNSDMAPEQRLNSDYVRR